MLQSPTTQINKGSLFTPFKTKQNFTYFQIFFTQQQLHKACSIFFFSHNTYLTSSIKHKFSLPSSNSKKHVAYSPNKILIFCYHHPLYSIALLLLALAPPHSFLATQYPKLTVLHPYAVKCHASLSLLHIPIGICNIISSSS